MSVITIWILDKGWPREW